MRSFPDWPSIRPTRSKSVSRTAEPTVATPKTTQSNRSIETASPAAKTTMVRVPLPSKKTVIGGKTTPPQQRDMKRRRSQFFRSGNNKASPPSVPQNPQRSVVDTDAVNPPLRSGRSRRKSSLARMAPFWRMGRKAVIPENDEKDETYSVDSDVLKSPPKGDGAAGPAAVEIKVHSYEEEEDTREGCEDSVLVTSHTSSSSSGQGLDVSDLRFSSDLGEVEVYIGDLIEDEEEPIEDKAEPNEGEESTEGEEEPTEETPAATPIQETQELPPPAPLPEPVRGPAPEPSLRAPSLLQPSLHHEIPMVEQSLAKQAAAEQMMASSSVQRRYHPLSAPVAMIERDMSDLVSELTLPRLPRSKSKQPRRKSKKKVVVEEDDAESEEHLQKESVIQVQKAISQLHKEGKSLSSHKIISTLLQVTDSLACKRDRALIRQQLSQLSSFSDNEEEDETTTQHDVAFREEPHPGPEEDEIRTMDGEESYVPGNMCQFPVGNHGVISVDGDDGSETSSFMDWLDHQEKVRPKSQWNVFSEMVDLSNYWNTPTMIQPRNDNAEDVLSEEDEDEQTVEEQKPVKNGDLLTPPKIYRTLSTGKSFQPRSFAQLQHEQQQKTAEEIRLEEDAIVAAGKRLLERHARSRTSSSSPANKPASEDEEDDVETTAREMLFIRKHTGPEAITLRSVPSDEMSHERYRAYIKDRDKERSKDRPTRGGSREPPASPFRRINVVPVQKDEDLPTKGGSREPPASPFRRINVVPVQKDENTRRSAAPAVMVASPSYAEEMRRRSRQQAAQQGGSSDPYYTTQSLSKKHTVAAALHRKRTEAAS